MGEWTTVHLPDHLCTERSAMPWIWTDDLARILLAAGQVDEARARAWLAAPVAIRSREDAEGATVARILLGADDDDPEPGELSRAA